MNNNKKPEDGSPAEELERAVSRGREGLPTDPSAVARRQARLAQDLARRGGVDMPRVNAGRLRGVR